MRIHYAISEDISKQWQSPDNGVPANKYSIYAFVLPVSWTETLYALRHGLDYYQYEYMIPGDDDIENQLKQWLDEMNPKFRTWVNMKEYPLRSDKQGEYRTEECTSISIRSAAPLFGRPALSEISDLFKIVSWHEEEGQWLNGPFLITYDKKFLGIIKEDISIEEYLSHRPMVQPAFLFKMLDTPSELDEVDSLETDFIVEIGLGNGKQLKDTAHVKLLMPEAIEEK
ncbi:MAG: hypothetical protein MJY72_02135 [Bacteroidales bacterium]|nr:hypothetical protein [Bacteroidales bacterium]